MARSGVSFFDVSQAAIAITDKGATPTVDRIRELLGTGSKSTIAPLLKQWKANQDSPSNTNGLPQQLMSAVENLYNTNQQIAEQQIQEITDQCNEQMNAVNKKSVAITSENNDLRAELKQLKQQLEETTKQHNQLQNDHTAQIEKLKDATSLTARLNDKLDRSETDKHELKLEIKAVRSHFEHYQEQIAEDRLIEREQAQTSLQLSQQHAQTLSSQIEELKIQHINCKQEIQTHIKHIGEITQLHREEEKLNSQLSNQLQHLESEKQALQKNYEAELQSTIALNAKLDKNEREATMAKDEITRLEISSGHLNNEMEKAIKREKRNEVKKEELSHKNAELNATIKWLTKNRKT